MSKESIGHQQNAGTTTFNTYTRQFEHPTRLTGGYFSRETGYDKLPFNCNEHKNPFSALKPEKKNTHTKKAVFLIQCNFIQDNLSNFTNDSISMLNADVFAFGYIHTEKIYLIK